MERKIAIVMMLVAWASLAQAAKEHWKVGVQCWTFHEKSLMETADYCQLHGIKYLEIYPGQRIGGDFDGSVKHDMPSERREKLKEELAKREIELVSYGCVNAWNEQGWDEIFSFCKEMGIDVVISEPWQNQMQTIDAMTKKYGIEFGIHNHANPTPNEVAQRLEGLSGGVGIAPDNGHWHRHGHEPIQSLKRFEGRVKSIHLKDVNAKGQDVPLGTGTTAVKAILDQLDTADYRGAIIIEYESGNEERDTKKCYDYLASYVGPGSLTMKPKAQRSDRFVSVDQLDTLYGNYDKRISGPGWSKEALVSTPSQPKAGSKAKERTGAVTASTEPADPKEAADKAFDGLVETKFCTLNPTTSFQVKLDAGRQKVSKYALISANDAPSRDPKEWRLLGSNDGENWTELDKESNEKFAYRFQRREFNIEKPGEYLYYKLDVIKNSGGGEFQIAELDLVGIVSKSKK